MLRKELQGNCQLLLEGEGQGNRADGQTDTVSAKWARVAPK